MSSEPLTGVAIVGLSGRFPGARDVGQFWRNILDGVESITPLSDADLLASGIDPALIRNPRYVKAARLLEDADLFDASFFGFTRREAEILDPQHRQFFECAWEALEDAGYCADTFEGQVGVFAGSTVSTYQGAADHAAHARDALETLQVLLGNDKDYLATQLSYRLNLTGPSIGVQTACSTSLTAACLASQALLTYQCDLALAGGVTIRLPQKTGYLYQEGGLFSPDGHCRSYDGSAAGVMFGSGVGVVALKRMEDAIENRDRIYAVIRGWAVNNDGSKKVGFTAPGAEGQVQVLTLAQAMADVEPASIGYLEGHGTATPLGDAIEISALKRVFRARTDRKRFCALGSVKSNVGHLDAAAGVAGLIKASLALHHSVLPPSPNFEQSNPEFDLENSPFFVNREAIEWQRGSEPRRAGVSSFGIGGTNAHTVLEEAPQMSAVRVEPSLEYLVPVSARTPEALRALAAAWVDGPLARNDATLHDLGYCAATRRTHDEQRLAVVARDSGELQSLLRSYLDDETNPSVVQGSRAKDRRHRLVFVFPGQGGQWFGMGRELMRTEPAFRQTMEKCAAALRPFMAGALLTDELLAAEQTTRFTELDFVQPAIFAMQVSMAALWRSWGMEPDAVIGHSMGEIAAAHVAGAITLVDASRIIARRSALARRLTGRGSMAMVELSMADCRRIINGMEHRVSVAAANGARTTVLSGDSDALQTLLKRFETQGVFCRFVKVDFASHSSQVDPILPDLRRELASIRPRAASVPIYSTVLGYPVDGTAMTGEYWVNNIREPVLFGPTVERLAGEGFDTFVELSPHPVLLASVQETAGVSAFASTRRDQPERAAMLQTLGALYTRGFAPDWKALYPQGGNHVSLPHYPWQHERFWMERTHHAPVAARTSGHPMLARSWKSSLQPQTVQWDCDLQSDTFAYLQDHRVDGAVVLPAAASVEAALSAARETFGPVTLEGVEFKSAMVVRDGEPARVQLSLIRNGSSGGTFQLAHEPGENTWTTFVTGRVRTGEPHAARDRISLDDIRRVCTDAVSGKDHYAAARAIGVEYGPGFQGLDRVWRGDGQALGRIRLSEDLVGNYAIHPAVLDACLQVFGHAAAFDEGVRVPVGLKSFWWTGLEGGGDLYVHALRSGDLRITDELGNVVGEVLGFETQAVSRERLDEIESWLYEIAWEKKPRETAAAVGLGKWLVIGSGLDLRPWLPDCLVVDEIASAFAPGTPPYSGIVYAGALDADSPDRALDCCAAVVALVQSVAAMSWRDVPRLWIATRRARAVASGDRIAGLGSASLWGLGRAIAMEHPELRCTLIDVEDGSLEPLASEVLADGSETAIALRGGERFVARLDRWHAPAPEPRPVGDRPFRAEIDTPGLLDSLVLREFRPSPPGPGEVQIRVAAAGLNFVDLLTAMGAYPAMNNERVELGGECSGVVIAVGEGVDTFQTGDEVIAMRLGSLASVVNAPACLTWRKPECLSFVDAAAIPVAFGTAYYALENVARLTRGESVLIHLGSGGVGLSAIQIAKRAGARVFATAGSPEKRRLLESLGVEAVMDSRSLDFADEVMARTNGRGVDVVLNSLTGEAVARGLSVLARYGRFVEIGKRDIYENSLIGLAPFRKGLSYTAVDLKAIAAERPDVVNDVLEQVLEGMCEGSFQPLPSAVVPVAEAGEAFRAFGRPDHIGKIVVWMEGASAAPVLPLPGAAVRSDATYVVTGGLGGLGLALVKWMISAGARNVAVLGRSGPGGEAVSELERARQGSARVEFFTADVSNKSDVTRVFDEIAAAWPPVRGVVHAAGVLDDGVLLNQDRERFARVLAPKVQGAWNLHESTLGLPLDFFVLYSSTAALLGSPGQANHGAANAFLDTLAHFRRAQGLPALSINWGPWADVGKAAGLRGAVMIPPERGLEIFGRLAGSTAAQVAVIPFGLRQWREFYPAASGGELVERWTGGGKSQSRAPFADELLKAPASDRLAMLAGHLAEQIGKVLRTAPGKVSRTLPLNAQGLDSLMALELRNRLENSLGLALRATLIWSYPTVEALSSHLAELLGLDSSSSNAPTTITQEVDEMSDDDATAELLAKLAELGH